MDCLRRKSISGHTLLRIKGTIEKTIVSIEEIARIAKQLSDEYKIKKVSLFGPYADGTYTDDSDIDLLVEFQNYAILLFGLSGLKIKLEKMLKKPVDVLYEPLPSDSMIYIQYAKVIFEEQNGLEYDNRGRV